MESFTDTLNRNEVKLCASFSRILNSIIILEINFRFPILQDNSNETIVISWLDYCTTLSFWLISRILLEAAKLIFNGFERQNTNKILKDMHSFLKQ